MRIWQTSPFCAEISIRLGPWVANIGVCDCDGVAVRVARKGGCTRTKSMSKLTNLQGAQSDVNGAKGAPGFLNLALQEFGAGDYISSRQGDGARLEFAKGLLDIATGGGDLVTAKNDL
ncbi:uncharacterized protein B0T23DRAFT_408906 [Neurospora hispaniola]|uniref:Uncharacterized protein n=1 Tax=Neurospora hispaniola TaxID=588809 RepID=A0AAJ0MLH4_9PEZI|nr:hypothetical protein B0T23DRAFT_408906 [Neurospora hispaniola]